MQTIPDLISNQLKQLVGIKPLEDGQMAEFRLTRAGVFDPSVGKPASPQAHIMPGMDMIKDTYDGQGGEKLIENIVGYNPIREKGKGTSYATIIEHVRFGHTGSLMVTSEQNNLFYFLKLHNKNRDNLNRKRTSPVVFYEVNEKKDLQIKNNLFDYKIYAGNILLEINSEGLQKLATRLNDFNKTRQKIIFQVTADFTKLLTEIKAYADANPVDVIMASDDRRSQLRIIVDVAADNRWVLYDEAGEQWIWSLVAKTGIKKPKVICKVESGNNPNRALVDYMISNKESGSIVATELQAKYLENYSIPK